MFILCCHSRGKCWAEGKHADTTPGMVKCVGKMEPLGRGGRPETSPENVGFLDIQMLLEVEKELRTE